MKVKIKRLNLIFENFFNGEVHAEGNLIQFFPKKKIKSLFVVFKGRYKNNQLKLREEYHDEKTKIIRNWEFKKISANYFTGNEENVRGKIIVDINKNHLLMKYLFKITIWKFSTTVFIKDHMYLISNNEIINTTYVSKFGLKLAKVVLLYKKKL